MQWLSRIWKKSRDPTRHRASDDIHEKVNACIERVIRFWHQTRDKFEDFPDNPENKGARNPPNYARPMSEIRAQPEEEKSRPCAAERVGYGIKPDKTPVEMILE